MANFGFSIGDIILISRYAYSVYKSCKHAGEEFKSIAADVRPMLKLMSGRSRI
ncbi:hypothetical protein CC86DRAFT_370885 [Ophiobolus disseminans]|uniref:Uncharacterized protein n=1 Tax=Ophiobolus disseminans TaxID=1469910 RepID=A0A6A6ZXG1_9PLEO|nr:hypothetical protein CC86DRAFT_370885 [Ophiobolus disseminans]